MSSRLEIFSQLFGAHSTIDTAPISKSNKISTSALVSLTQSNPEIPKSNSTDQDWHFIEINFREGTSKEVANSIKESHIPVIKTPDSINE